MNTAVREQPSQALETVPDLGGRAVVAVTPMEMLAAAVARGTDMAQLEKLMDLQERWEANNARKAFVAAMAKFKENPPTLVKDKRVGYTNRDGSFTGYTHATLAEVATKIAAGLGAVGISHRWDVHHENGLIIVSCTLTHEGGHSETVTMPPVAPDDSGKKNSIQQVASAITYQQRYSLLAITGLAAKDQDDDGQQGGEWFDQRTDNASTAPRSKPATDTPQPRADSAVRGRATVAQVALVRRKLEGSAIHERDFLRKFSIIDLAELPFAKVDEALAYIKQAGS